MLSLNENDFRKLITFIKGRYGIDLSQKRQLIIGRLSNTVVSMGYSTFTEYIDHILSQKNPQDIELMLNKLTTNYTFFLRESAHFDYFRDTVLPYLERTKRDHVLSIWSAGCSSGQEPYTLSMILKEYFGAKAGNWDTRILATDISQKALSAAKKGVYELPDTVPEVWRKKYFKKLEGSQYAVSPEIRNNVIFQTFNLMDPIRFRTKFDVIFCRNVMIYFDQPTKDALLRRFYEATVPGGYLMISHSENLSKDAPYTTVAPSTFQKK